jgi:hypothetical protein
MSEFQVSGALRSVASFFTCQRGDTVRCESQQTFFYPRPAMFRIVEWMRTLHGLTVGLLGLTEYSYVHAQDIWSRPHPAVWHLHRQVGTLDWHLVTINLRYHGVRVVGTPSEMLDPSAPGRGHAWRTTSAFAHTTGADIAVNANYYDIYNRAFTSCGLTVSGGNVWDSTYVDRRLECWESVGFGSQGRVAFFDSHGKAFGPVPESWMTEVVTGSPRVLAHNEVLRYTEPHHALARNPRTLVGASADRNTLFLMVVNGREGANKGVTCPEAARILQDFGASDAVNLDGGGSSTLYIRSEGGLVSHPADGVERAVGNHLGVILDAHETSDAELPQPARPVIAVPTSLPLNAIVVASESDGAVVRAPEKRHVGCQIAPWFLHNHSTWGVLKTSLLVVLTVCVRRTVRHPTVMDAS